MRNFDIYEFAGIVVPGVLLIFGAGVLWPDTPLKEQLTPTAIGASLVHLVAAYGIGHMIHGLANIWEGAYWKLWRGMPTQWPVSKPHKEFFPGAIEKFHQIKGVETPAEDIDRATWTKYIRDERARVYGSGNPGRLQVFLANYGMFRAFFMGGLILGAAAWTSELDWKTVYPVIGGVAAVSWYRMHHFSVLYARELFALIDVQNAERSLKPGQTSHNTAAGHLTLEDVNADSLEAEKLSVGGVILEGVKAKRLVATKLISEDE